MFWFNACTQTFAKILITRISIIVKDDILAQKAYLKPERGLKKIKEIGFLMKAGAICHPDTAKPELENNFARFIYHFLDLELQILPFPPSSNI